MEELNIIPTEEPESGGSHDTGEQALDDATYEPQAFVEQSGDYQQAEDIQKDLVKTTSNASTAAEKEGATPLPIPRPEGDSLAGSFPGVRGDLDQVGWRDDRDRHDATPITLPGQQEPTDATPITLPGVRGVAESQPEVRGDLGQAASAGQDSGGDEATPINLPGPQEVAENPEQDLDGRLVSSDRAQGQPELPSQQDEYEKPILHKEPKDLDSGLGKMDDIESFLPTPGKIGNAPGEKSQEQDPLSGMPGLKGFRGGPSDLKNDAGAGPGMHSEKGHEIPGWDSPFPPGKGPNKGMETQGGGAKKPAAPPAKPKTPAPAPPSNEKPPAGNKPNAPKGSEKYPAFVVTGQRKPVDAGSQTLVYNKYSGEFETADQVMDRINMVLMWATEDINRANKNKYKDPDAGGGKDTSIPLSEQMQGDRMNPKFDAGQVSNYPEEHIAGKQGGGHPLKEEQAEAVKRTLEKQNKLAHAKPKAGAEQVTDPPEHDPNPKKSGAGGEAG